MLNLILFMIEEQNLVSLLPVSFFRLLCSLLTQSILGSNLDWVSELRNGNEYLRDYLRVIFMVCFGMNFYNTNCFVPSLF